MEPTAAGAQTLVNALGAGLHGLKEACDAVLAAPEPGASAAKKLRKCLDQLSAGLEELKAIVDRLAEQERDGAASGEHPRPESLRATLERRLDELLAAERAARVPGQLE